MKADDAEAWLQEHDPLYQRNTKRWKQLRGGYYVCPRQEIPWGNSHDLAILVDSGQAYVERAGWKSCDKCLSLFVPNASWQRFCCVKCRQRSLRRNRAAYMRSYRRKRKA